MVKNFSLLDGNDDVINLHEGNETCFLNQPMFKLKDFILRIKQNLLGIQAYEWDRENNSNLERKRWIEEGMDCEILHLGSNQWRKGKIRVKVIVEFCPDETESPLDDIRKTLSEHHQ